MANADTGGAPGVTAEPAVTKHISITGTNIITTIITTGTNASSTSTTAATTSATM